MGNTSDVKDFLEKYQKSKEYKDYVKEFNRKLYFNKRFRNDLRKHFLKVQKDSLYAIEKISLTSDIQSHKTYTLSESLLDLAALYLDACKKADKLQESKKITKSRFKLFKKIKEKGIIFKCLFYKPSEKKNKINYLSLPKGLSRKKKICFLIRKRHSLKGYVLADEGTFIQKIISFEELIFTFKGKKIYKIKCSKRGKIQDNLWARLINS